MEWSVGLSNGNWYARHPSGKEYRKRSFESAAQCRDIGRRLEKLKIDDPDGSLASELADDLVARATWQSGSLLRQSEVASEILKNAAMKNGSVPTQEDALAALNAARIASMVPPLESLDDLRRLYTEGEEPS